MEWKEDVTALVHDETSPITRSYTGVDLNGDYCRYTIRVYPSTLMHEDYVSNKPIIYTVLVALIFVFTSGIFLLYDLLVERRQNIVMDNAKKSGAVVASLFPTGFRDRLYEGTAGANKKKPKSKWYLEKDHSERSEKGDVPIAEKYSEATVLFADLAGFTHWSSKREAEDVFFLLESLYKAFDNIAMKRGVFKIEVCILRFPARFSVLSLSNSAFVPT